MKIGSHVSVAGGFTNGLEYAAHVGAECIQFFAKSPRQWRAKPIDEDQASAFRQMRAETYSGPVFTHTAYLINLSTNNEELRAQSVEALTDELVRAFVLGADAVVTHVGNDPGGDWRLAAKRAADSIRQAFEPLEASGASIRLLLENTAGSGTSFGCTFEQLAECITLAEKPSERLGICLDTCHAFAHGYDVGSESGWRDVVDEIVATAGLDRLGLIHANDCMFELGSHRDRHAWIGDGYIGVEGFRAMVCHDSLGPVSVITEMPGEKPDKDCINIARLIEMRDTCHNK